MKRYVFVPLIALILALLFIFKPKSPITYVDFDTSMRTTEYGDLFKNEYFNQIYAAFRGNYAANNPSKITCDPHLKIPKIIHQIWLGSPFPEKYKSFQHSWIIHHPDWEYRLWTDAELEDLPMVNRDMYEAARNYGERSDIARYEILYQFGGLYVDTDEECLKPFDPLHYCYDFYIGIQPLDTNSVQLGIGVIGAAPLHPFLKIVVATLHKSTTKQIIARTGPLFLTKIFVEHMHRVPGINIALPATYFYPKGYTETDAEKSRWLKNESFAIHHWEGSWLKKEAFKKD
jgi:mannosyltransferase OCH1-like enzyme